MAIHVARWSILIFLMGLLSGFPVRAEFYKYTDRNGKTHFVDEIWKVPEAYRGQAGRYREKYDHLPEGQKNAVIEAEQGRRRLMEIEQERQTELHLQELRQRQASERLEQAEREMQREFKSAETPVTIAGNQILVPVAFVNSGLETSVHMIMDTGATHTVLYRPVASQLNVYTLAKGHSKVAGGHAVQSEIGKVDSMRIGPITAKDFAVVILSVEGPPPAYAGLLGMDFLSRVEYRIDYDKSTIRWKLRPR